MKRFAVDRRLAIAVIALGAALVAFAGMRTFIRESDRTAAVLTPKMSARREFSSALGPRLYRVLNARPAVRDGKAIALTFDDGPYPIFTPLLLDELQRLHVRATFFLIGRDAMQWPALAQRIARDGEEIGDHTFSHPDLDRETPAQVREEILRGRNVLWALTHERSVDWIMRPPHGRYTLETLRVAQNLGYHVVLWTDDSGDFRMMTPEEIVHHVERYATRPEIVLLHSGKLATIEALPTIVARFRAAGYRFLTVTELLRAVGAEAINHPLRRSL